jgi:four helix bundle protein
MVENVVKNKSFEFAIQVVKIYQFLRDQKKEYTLSRQLLRSGTSVGAMIREAEYAETKNDFIHKMGIAQKEVNETLYWLELLYETEYLTQEQSNQLTAAATEIIKLITSIIKTTKSNLNKNKSQEFND